MGEKVKWDFGKTGEKLAKFSLNPKKKTNFLRSLAMWCVLAAAAHLSSLLNVAISIIY